MAKLKTKKEYVNYKKGESPRKNREEKSFSASEFPSAEQQILKLF